MSKHYPIYKGLEMPLVFRGFKGRFIFWALGTLLLSFFSAAILTSIFSVYLGAITMVLMLSSGLFLTLSRQKKGQHLKRNPKGVFIYPNLIRLNYAKK